ncbi:MAG TPA: 50S ribosomal protein L13 [Candidatus Thorarchaeota archaeon]|nr:MAG: 50S ribosomal protein L13 [Candidatus Thorarchaeota archaeon]RLI62284.1 MAG: 50S ribosomal protein L13 [Candidatus Thorarchaeota archaeon]HDD67630.1 50S ribosomal protein L13 [Candidatus Thorarchaeota archaeon]
MSEKRVKVFDAENMVVGRLAAKAAKAALLGDSVIIVNAEKAVITGDRRTVIDAYKAKRNIRTSYNPRRGPFHHRRPDKLVRRVIRGMLPWPKPRGKEAYKRVRVYIGVPEKYAESERIVLEGARYRSLTRKHITVGDLCYELGWRNPAEVA